MSYRIAIVALCQHPFRCTLRITPDQHAKLERLAKTKERSVAWVVRNMIDRVTEGK